MYTPVEPLRGSTTFKGEKDIQNYKYKMCINP